LEYALGDEHSYLWAVTNSRFSSYVLPKRSELEEKVRAVRAFMTPRSLKPGESTADALLRFKKEEAQYRTAAADLSRMLLGPVADQLGTRRILIVGEGALQYLPFGALSSPSSIQNSSPNLLIVEHEIVNLPSASTLAVIRKEAALREKPQRTLAIFADPVFQPTDKRVIAKSRSELIAKADPKESARGDSLGGTLPRLLAAEKEAKAIAAMVPEKERFVALGFDATRSAAMAKDLGRYKIVHFATHAVLNESHPDLSSLVMSLVDRDGNPQNGYVRLRDIYNLRLSADLVVLSACETALGKEVKGEGLMSMVRGFMYSGTPRVLASLWKVDDEATAELMTEFYKELLQNKRPAAAALRQAQITQMQKKLRQSPYYWAAFQLQGEFLP
jgi:CHAT domain-containing protein